MLAARPWLAAASRQKCLATTRAFGVTSGRRRLRGAAESASASSYGGSTRTTSNGDSAARAGSRSQATASAPDDGRPIRLDQPGPLQVARDRRIAPASCSTNVAWAAPRDSASMPPAPLPANRSRNRAPAQVRLQDREQRLLDAIAERSRARARGVEPDRARLARRSRGRRQARASGGAVTNRSPGPRPRAAEASRCPARGGAVPGPPGLDRVAMSSRSRSAAARARTASSR